MRCRRPPTAQLTVLAPYDEYLAEPALNHLTSLIKKPVRRLGVWGLL
jgi:hypothetical protein